MGCQFSVIRRAPHSSNASPPPSSQCLPSSQASAVGSQFSAIRRAPHSSTASPPSPGTSIETHRRSEDSQTHRQTLMEQSNRSQRQLIRIDILPDDVLLEIFDFYTYRKYGGNYKKDTESWQSLVHVCRRWRSLVFASPRRLDLQLYCTPTTPAGDRLNVWPALPLIIGGSMASSGTDNVIAALGQNNCVRQVVLYHLKCWQVEQVLAAMQVPFPELEGLSLVSPYETPRLIPDSFLNGSAPRLRYVRLHGIPFPGLPRLLLSAPHLVHLELSGIPHSGYFSPESIVALLSVLSSLEHLTLQFQSPPSSPDWESRRPPPPKRSVIPALLLLDFSGVTEYLEDVVSFIDTPRLGEMHIMFLNFNQIDFNTPQLAQFINRTFKLVEPDARVEFCDVSAQLFLGALDIGISCRESDRQLSSIEQICNSSLHQLSTVEDLRIRHRHKHLVWNDNHIEDTLWLQLLLPFIAVKNLYLDEEFSQGIATALNELVGDRITEVLPSMQKIFVAGLEPRGRFRQSIGQFIAARQLSGHPITVSRW